MRTWLKEKRLAKNLESKEIATLCSVSRQFYNMIEVGVRRPSPEVAIKIAEILEFDWTLFYENNSHMYSCTKTNKISDHSSFKKTKILARKGQCIYKDC